MKIKFRMESSRSVIASHDQWKFLVSVDTLQFSPSLMISALCNRGFAIPVCDVTFWPVHGLQGVTKASVLGLLIGYLNELLLREQ